MSTIRDLYVVPIQTGNCVSVNEKNLSILTATFIKSKLTGLLKSSTLSDIHLCPVEITTALHQVPPFTELLANTFWPTSSSPLPAGF